MNAKPSQTQKVVERLRAAKGNWVPMPDLWQASGAFAVHSRVSDARIKLGLTIDQRNEHVNGECHSFYRIVE